MISESVVVGFLPPWWHFFGIFEYELWCFKNGNSGNEAWKNGTSGNETWASFPKQLKVVVLFV